MSQVRKETVECMHCHAEGQFDYWASVNVDLDPELREKVFNEELFLFHCPKCGKVPGMPAGTLYHDMKHEFMLFFEFFKPDDYKNEPIELPKEMGLKGNYTLRTVHGLNRLKEKIMILEQGLNDIAIERQKYMISHVILPEIAEKGCELYFDRVEEGDETFEYGKIFYTYIDREKGEQAQVRFAMDNYYEHCKACEIDPRMAVKNGMCVDEEWMNQIMKEE